MMMIGKFGKMWLPATQPCFFRESDQGRYTVEESDEGQQHDEGDGILYCRQCLAPVTSEQERMTVLGKHSHAFANPEGMVFEIGCFGLAPGCVKQGRSTLQYSWFPPHAWSFVLCRTCAIHLGWYYEAVGKSSFHGLILNRLVGE